MFVIFYKFSDLQNNFMSNINFIKNIRTKLSKIKNKDINLTTNKILNLKEKNKIILAGNGASSSISSHASTDFTKAAGVRAINFNEANLLTCFSNDYGYENWILKALEFYSLPGDLLILISSSGKSKNILKAAKNVRKLKIGLITFSGFSKNNPLSKLGEINFHVDSKNYNVIESTHLVMILQIVENIINKKGK